jgi:hypothetical protein
MTTKTTPDKDWLDDYCHYNRVCINCGHVWWGLHCPHDGYQNPCPKCDIKPEPVVGGYCECDFVVPVAAINAKITELLVEARIDEWDFIDTIREVSDEAIYQAMQGRVQELQASQPQTNLNESEM